MTAPLELDPRHGIAGCAATTVTAVHTLMTFAAYRPLWLVDPGSARDMQHAVRAVCRSQRHAGVGRWRDMRAAR